MPLDRQRYGERGDDRGPSQRSSQVDTTVVPHGDKLLTLVIAAGANRSALMHADKRVQPRRGDIDDRSEERGGGCGLGGLTAESGRGVRKYTE